MSNYLALATVTATLRTLLWRALEDVASEGGPSGAKVTTLRPDVIGKDPQAKGVNVFLYQSTPNAALRNADQPVRRADGSVRQRPVTALDLHYLLTFYGREEALEPQQLLGLTVRTLNDCPTLTPQLIQEAVAAGPEPFLAASDLAQSVERVRFTPVPLTLEEISKFWTVFFQQPYALSLVYQASVVLIDGRPLPQPALPVEAVRLTLRPLGPPAIEAVTPHVGLGETLRVRSVNLDLVGARLLLGSAAFAPDALDDGELTLELTADRVAAAGLTAGLCGVRVVDDSGLSTDTAPFLLLPSFESLVHVDPADAGASAGDWWRLEVAPPLAPLQPASLLLNPHTARAGEAPPRRAWTVPARRDSADPSLAFVELGAVARGAYLTRVRVGDATSRLAFEPGVGFTAPIVELT